jgi:exodeoxyribonuclease-1
MDLEPIGEPHNILISLHEDVIPDPEAIMITGISPQQTLLDGVNEHDFLQFFHQEIATPETIFVGYNSVRFDDEFMRFLHYRNFYDAYEWSWKDGRSRWDLLDVVRMTRALRPDGIEWPFSGDGTASNRLELMTHLNKLSHSNAHDALSDVLATIAVARLIRQKQPKLFDFLLSMRAKNKVRTLVESGQQFLYTSGKYPSDFQKTTVAALLGPHPDKQGSFVFDLRHDPTSLLSLEPVAIAERWYQRTDDLSEKFPIKTLQYNRCPAVAPMTVLDDSSKQRIKIDMGIVDGNYQKFLKHKEEVYSRIIEAQVILEKKHQATLFTNEKTVDEQLYDDFIDKRDMSAMSAVRTLDKKTINSFGPNFYDKRLEVLFFLYKARNYKHQLTDEERQKWQEYIRTKIGLDKPDGSIARVYQRLELLKQKQEINQGQKYALEDLELYLQSKM